MPPVSAKPRWSAAPSRPRFPCRPRWKCLKADTSKLPAVVGVDLPGQGYGVYRIVKVSQAANPDPARRKAELEQINGAVGQQDLYHYLEGLKQKAKVKINHTAAATPAQ